MNDGGLSGDRLELRFLKSISLPEGARSSNIALYSDKPPDRGDVDMSKANTSLVLIVVALLLTGYFGASRLGVTGRDNAEKVKKRLADSVARKRGNKEEVMVKLKDLTDFKWDKVYIFPPYTGLGTIDNDLGFVWPRARTVHIDYRDDINLIIFTDNRQVVAYVEHPRSLGDLDGSYKREGYSQDEAIFMVEEGPLQPDGRPWLRLRKQ